MSTLYLSGTTVYDETLVRMHNINVGEICVLLCVFVCMSVTHVLNISPIQRGSASSNGKF